MKKSVFFITRSALVAAIYFALATALQPVSFGPVQFRLSEALVLLPVFMPESVIGVTLGCFLSNFFYSTMYDVIFEVPLRLSAAHTQCDTRPAHLGRRRLGHGVFSELRAHSRLRSHCRSNNRLAADDSAQKGAGTRGHTFLFFPAHLIRGGVRQATA